MKVVTRCGTETLGKTQVSLFSVRAATAEERDVGVRRLPLTWVEGVCRETVLFCILFCP